MAQQTLTRLLYTQNDADLFDHKLQEKLKAEKLQVIDLEIVPLTPTHPSPTSQQQPWQLPVAIIMATLEEDPEAAQ